MRSFRESDQLQAKVKKIAIRAPEFCGFCFTPNIYWLYRVGPPGASIANDEWRAACETCHDLFEGGDWAVLAQRCIELAGQDSPKTHEELVKIALDYFEWFAASRKGNPVPRLSRDEVEQVKLGMWRARKRIRTPNND
jgi:hypothetical protein